MSITAYKVEAVGHDRTGEDYGYVNIMYRYGNKQSCPRPDQCEKIEVMWADESVYGPPAPGSKVGDFIKTWLMGSWDCGVFTHREIAQRLMDTFTGLKVKELAWFENPREKTLKNGKPRARRAKWLPEQEVDLVYLYSCLLYTSDTFWAAHTHALAMADVQTGEVISGRCYLSWPLLDKEREAGDYSKRFAKGKVYRIMARRWKGDELDEPRWYVTQAVSYTHLVS